MGKNTKKIRRTMWLDLNGNETKADRQLHNISDAIISSRPENHTINSEHTTDKLIRRRWEMEIEMGRMTPDGKRELTVDEINNGFYENFSDNMTDTGLERDRQLVKAIQNKQTPFMLKGNTIVRIPKKDYLSYKGYVLPTGQIKYVRGYEPYALDILFHQYNYSPYEVSFGNTAIPTVYWFDKHRIKHRYRADIYIEKEKRLIEVKSIWTYFTKDTEALERIDRTALACIASGYRFEYWIFDKNGNRTVIDKFDTSKTNIDRSFNISHIDDMGYRLHEYYNTNSSL